MTPDNKPLVRFRLECAEEALKESRTLIENGLTRGAVSRSYYAMFYAACSLLATKRLAFGKHSAVIATFQKEFIKSGQLPAIMGDWLREGFKMRGTSDYMAFASIDKTNAEELLKNAESFVEKARIIVEEELR